MNLSNPEILRTEYRALAIDPSGEGDHYVGSATKTPHEAYDALRDEWNTDSRELALEKRTVRESPWTRVSL